MSVLQGYIRLLQRQREAGHPEIAMLDAMLDATARLTTIARQASDLGNWLAAIEARPFGSVPVTAITDALAERLRHASPTIALLPIPSTSLTLRADPGVLAGAILALAESMQRDNESAVIEISLIDSPADGSVAFAIGPAPSASGAATAPHRPTSPREPSFERGGAGLALIAASHVFGEHSASIETSAEPGHVVIRFPHPGGSL
ncbi:MAG: hypothetical protein IT183_11310 [Acidobacteria bacterium]|nr:hypothetical protein [Acidobacteriota bacterium]